MVRGTIGSRRVGALLCGSAAGLLAWSPAQAQDAGALLRQKQQQEELKTPQKIEPKADPLAPLPMQQENGETVLVRALHFAGKLDLLPEVDRRRIAATAVGKRLGISGIRAIADRATQAIQARGHMLGYAQLLPQDVTQGEMTITLAEGTLDAIEVERAAGTRIDAGLLARILNQQNGGTVRKADLEAALLRIGDLPGVSAHARLTPGARPGTTRLSVQVDERPPVSFEAWGDNGGAASTGRWQANAAVTLADLSGAGEMARLSGTLSEGQRYFQAAVALPLDATGVSLNASYAYLEYRNRDAIGRALDLNGHAQFLTYGLEAGLLRARALNLRFTAGLSWKALADDSLLGRLQDKRILAGTLGLHGDARDTLGGGGLTSWSIDWSYGKLDLSRVPAALAADRAGLRADGSFHHVDINLVRLQKLPGNFSMLARAYGQWASRNLDSSEEIALGGPYAVRGYGVGDGQGDAGLIETIELRYDAPFAGGHDALQLAGFFDAGRIWINADDGRVPLFNQCGCNSYALSSVGAAARWTHRNFNVSLSYAVALGSNPGRSAITGANADGTRDRSQFWLQGALRF